MPLPHNTPMTNVICDINSMIYSLNQNCKIVSFDKNTFMKEPNKSLNIKFSVDKHCQHGLTLYNQQIKKLLRRNLYEKVIMSKFGNDLLFIAENKLLFVNINNGNVKCIDLDLNNFTSNACDFGVINEEFMYICDPQRVDIYKLNEIDANKTDIKLIKSVDLENKLLRASTVIKNDILYLWLMGNKYIQIKVKGADSVEVDRGCFNVERKNTNNCRQTIVDALVVDDEHILLYLSKGTIIVFNVDKQEVVNIVNPVVPSAWVNRMINDEWMFVRGILLSPPLTDDEIHKLIFGYIREEHNKNVPYALKKVVTLYYEESKEPAILFTGAMDWETPIGKSKNLKNMRIISAGKYVLSDGKYHEIQGSKLRYK